MSISFFLAWEWRWMGFKSNDQPGQSSEVECNTKMSISFFWLEKGSGFGSSPSTSPANHQKLNIIEKLAFHFFGLRGGGWALSPSTSLADDLNYNIIQKQAFHFLVGKRLQMGLESFGQPGWSSEVENNPKMSISFLWLERGGRWGSSPLTSLADHPKLNVIQKWAFHFLAGEG